MGRVDCISRAGWECWFWSQDHREAHFHVRCPGKWEVRIFFGEDPPYYDVQWQAGRISGKAMRSFLDLVAENRALLLEEWETKVTVVDP